MKTLIKILIPLYGLNTFLKWFDKQNDYKMYDLRTQGLMMVGILYMTYTLYATVFIFNLVTR